MIEQLNALIVWLDAHQTGVVALSTVILTLTTIVYAWLTSILAKENRLLRRAGTEPQVIAYLSPNQRHIGALEFVVANIGHGPAYDVAYTLTSGGEDFGAHSVRIKNTEVATSILPQGEQVRRFVGAMAWDLLKEPKLKPFTVRVEYFDGKRRKSSNSFRMNIEEFLGVGKLGNSAEDEAAEALKKIAKEMEAWRRAWQATT